MVILSWLSLNDSFNIFWFILNFFTWLLILFLLRLRRLFILLNSWCLNFKIKRKSIFNYHRNFYTNIPSLLKLGRLDKYHAELLFMINEKLFLLNVSFFIKVAYSEWGWPNLIISYQSALSLLEIFVSTKHNFG